MLIILLTTLLAGGPATQPVKAKPVMRDFIGLNTHTVQFKPELYGPVTRVLRDYHPVDWDAGGDTSAGLQFPMAANKVDWSRVYGAWTAAGNDVDACLQFDPIAFDHWKDPARDAEAYGRAFAKAFGPSAAKPLVHSAEIGNEPANYSEAQYRTIFQNMARGLRAGDAKLRIATCAVMAGKPDKWSKPLSAVAGLEDLYDILNVHTYAMAEGWPTWRRSFPEDPKIEYLKSITSVIDWRNEHAAGKEIWVTEFGYDASTKPTPKTGQWNKWVGVTDTQQAQYIVRSYLVFSAMDVERAYLYFFNDKDEPQLHGASGITRDFHPKPSFYAMAHLLKTLGDYRFSRVVAQTAEDVYCYEYQHATKPNERVVVAWSPTGAGRTVEKGLALGGVPYKAERMPLAPGEAEVVGVVAGAGGRRRWRWGNRRCICFCGESGTRGSSWLVLPPRHGVYKCECRPLRGFLALPDAYARPA